MHFPKYLIKNVFLFLMEFRKCIVFTTKTVHHYKNQDNSFVIITIYSAAFFVVKEEG